MDRKSLKLNSEQSEQLRSAKNIKNKEIGNRLRELRGNEKQRVIAYQLRGKAQRDKTTGEVIEKRMTEAGYNKIENGNSSLTFENALRLAEYYGVSIDYILYGKDADMVPMLKQDKKIDQFLSSLGIRQYNTKLTRFIDVESGKDIPYWEEGTNVENVQEKNELLKSVSIGNNSYDVDFDKWDDIIAIAMDTARAAVEAVCRRYDRTDIKNKEADYGKHN